MEIKIIYFVQGTTTGINHNEMLGVVDILNNGAKF